MLSGFINLSNNNISYEIYNELQKLENNFTLDPTSISNYNSEQIKIKRPNI
jgi:hypothetical protein